ncbi:type II secretion system protein GspN [Thermodesulfobacteriota bacterium]
MSKNKKKGLIYTLYIFIATAFFFYVLFPDEVAKKYITNSLINAYPALNVTIDRIKPTLPPGLQLYNVGLDVKKNSMFGADRIKIVFGLLSMFQSNKRLIFKGRSYEGKFKGNIHLKRGNPGRMSMEADIAGIELQKIPILRNASDRKISGILEGKITYDSEKSANPINARFELSNGSVEILSPIVPLENLTFKTIETDVDINEKRINLKRCVFKGHQIDGEISGVITIGEPFGKSVINLSGTVKPQASFFAELRKTLPANLLPKKRKLDAGFPIILNGTIDEPGFLLK